MSQLAVMAAVDVAIGAIAGLWIDRKRAKYHALAEAEREARRHPAS